MNNRDTLVWVFVGVWVVLAVGNAAFFLGSKNAKLKKRLFPWAMAFFAAVFALFLLLVNAGQPEFLVALPVLMLIVWINVRATKFCESCGATVVNYLWFMKMRYCPRCGADLQSGNNNEPRSQGLIGRNHV